MNTGQENDTGAGRPGNSESASIGRRLTLAREARKLTIEKVADKLNLDVRVVDA